MKPIAPKDLTPKQRRDVASWLDDQIHDMDPDADSIAEEWGYWFLPALRGLAKDLRTRKKKP